MIRNTFKTAILLAALGGLLIGAGQLFFGSGGATIGLLLGLLFAGGSYWFSDKLAIKATRAEPLEESRAPHIYRMVRELTASANMPMPRLYITPEQQPNAFATGRNDRKAVVAVTQGITEILDENELRGVIAHELAHIRNRDILIGSVAAAVAMGITFSARMLMWGAMFGGSDDEGGNPLGALALALLAPIAAAVLQMAVSRSREFEADRVGAGIAGSGEGLARALEKLHTTSKRIPMNVNPAQEHAFIVSPLTGSKQSSFAKLFSTHPPVEERVARLRSPQMV